MEVRSIISAARLIDGGAAIFAAENINHKMLIRGKNLSMPLVRKRLRVLVVSYRELAKANRAEDENP
jgi:hypothetical protein